MSAMSTHSKDFYTGDVDKACTLVGGNNHFPSEIICIRTGGTFGEQLGDGCLMAVYYDAHDALRGPTYTQQPSKVTTENSFI